MTQLQSSWLRVSHPKEPSSDGLRAFALVTDLSTSALRYWQKAILFRQNSRVHSRLWRMNSRLFEEVRDLWFSWKIWAGFVVMKTVYAKGVPWKNIERKELLLLLLLTVSGCSLRISDKTLLSTPILNISITKMCQFDVAQKCHSQMTKMDTQEKQV